MDSDATTQLLRCGINAEEKKEMSMNNENIRHDDQVQHGIDDSPSGDAEKGAALGGLGGVAVGAAAGSVAGPVGTVIGAVAGGLLGAGASGAAVAAIDQVDNDNTVSGIGDGATRDVNAHSNAGYAARGDYETGVHSGGVDAGGHNIVTGDEAHTDAGKSGLATGAVVGGVIGTAVGGPVGAAVGGTLGSLAGGVAGDAAEAADEETMASGTAANNFRNSENTGYNNIGAADLNADTPAVGGIGTTAGYRSNDVTDGIGNDVPGVQTGGMTTRGEDTRGISEKTADAITGDRTDDKTGGRVL